MSADAIILSAAMNKSITIRAAPELVEQIGALATALDRSRNWVIEDALKQYLAQQTWFLEGIRQAQASLDQGEGMPHEALMAEVEELLESLDQGTRT
jgi:predicted transcriptional regulator